MGPPLTGTNAGSPLSNPPQIVVQPPQPPPSTPWQQTQQDFDPDYLNFERDFGHWFNPGEDVILDMK